MAITANWYHKPDKIIVEINDSWTWRDFDRAVQKSYDLMAEVEGIVDVIFHVSQSANRPGDNAFAHWKRAIMYGPSNFRLCIVVSSDPLVVSMMQASQSVFGKTGRRIHVCPSMTIAEMIITAVNEEAAPR